MCRKVSFITVVFLLCAFGCSHIGFQKSVDVSPPSLIDHGQILQKFRLAKGGNLLIVPFDAGDGIAATEELDRISLMIVRGMASVLQNRHSRFKVLVADNAASAQMVIEGYVVKMTAPGRFQKWMPGVQKKSLAVEGKLIEMDKGRVVVRFSHHREATEPDQSFEQIGLSIGEDIGRFILTGGKGKRKE